MTSSSAGAVNEAGLTAVLAHSMLGTVTAIRGAIELAMTEASTTMTRDSLMLLAMQRLEILTKELRELAAGVPGDVRSVLDPALRQGDHIVADGTQVELYSAFSRTWSPGFEIANAAELGYRVRRLSDGSLLPGYTSRTDLRRLDERVEFRA